VFGLKLTTTGTVTLGADAGVHFFGGAMLTLGGGISGAHSLTLAGPGRATLASSLDAATTMVVPDLSTLAFTSTPAGHGTITVSGGTLLGATGNPFAGTVKLLTGTIKVTGTNSLGTASLIVGKTTGPATIDANNSTTVTLANPLTFQGGTLSVPNGTVA